MSDKPTKLMIDAGALWYLEIGRYLSNAHEVARGIYETMEKQKCLTTVDTQLKKS